MEKFYTVNEITSYFDISKTTFYAQVKKNQSFFADNSVKAREEGNKNKPYVKYNQSVFDFFASQYGKGEDVKNDADASLLITKGLSLEDASFTSPKAPENSHTEPQSPQDKETHANPLETKIEALEAQIEALQSALAKRDEENAELIKQNGNLLLLLSQEKQEKQMLLPAPRKTIGERFKGLFRK